MKTITKAQVTLLFCGHLLKRKASRFAKLTIFCIALFLLSLSANADFPPVLQIDGTAYTGYITSDGTANCMEYYAGGGVLVLHGANGGAADWGGDEDAAFNSPTIIGTWDGGSNVYLNTHIIVVPQVILYSNDASAPVMQGYDGANVQATATGTSDSGSLMVVYTGIPNGYIFTFSDGTPAYRYSAGPDPVIIDSTNGWPPGDVFNFPSQIYVNGVLLTVSGASESSDYGYSGDAYYQDVSGDITGDFHVYIESSGTAGSMWGYANGVYYGGDDNNWNPNSNLFTVEPGVGISLAPPAAGPTYGPPMITYDGTLLTFQYNDTQGSDVYVGTAYGQWSVYGTHTVIINGTSVTGIDGYGDVSTGSYNPQTYAFSQTFTNQQGNMAAVSADGRTMLGLPPGILLTNTTWYPYLTWTWWQPWLQYGPVQGSEDLASQPFDYSLPRTDGTNVFKYTNVSNYAPWAAFNFSQYPFGWGIYYAYAGGEMVFDASQPWPASNLPALPFLPNDLYLNGTDLSSDVSTNTYPGAPSGFFLGNYADYANGTIQLQLWYDSPTTITGWLSGSGFGSVTISSLADIQAAYQSVAGAGNVLTLGQPGETPSYGPPSIAIDGYLLLFSYNDGNGNDIYADYSDNNAPFVTISSTGQMNEWEGWVNDVLLGSATYNATTFTFSSPSATASGNINDFNTLAAVGWNGGLLAATPPGFVVLFSSQPEALTPLVLGNGGSLNTSNAQIYTYPQSDGSWVVKYIPLSSAGVPKTGFVAFDDANGNSISPVYTYNINTTDSVVDTRTSGDWPPTNLYPTQIYINGQYAYLNNTTQYNTLGAVGGSGGVAYQVESTGDTIWVNWTFDPIFQATVYGSFNSVGFNGTWDGGAIFAGLPAGIIISLQAPPGGVRYGPPDIQWNGINLVFNPLDSTVNANNPSGADVYQDEMGLGLSASVNSGGNVILTEANGTQLTGTYNSSTYQFSVTGQPSGSVLAVDSQGHVLNPPTGGSSGAVNTGNFDIQGDVLSLGSWTPTSGGTMNGFSLVYNDTQDGDPSLLRFLAARQTVDWIWSHATTDGGSIQSPMMQVDSGNRLWLYNPVDPTKPAMVLDPGGQSHIEPQGDVGMGIFITQPQQ